VAAVYAIAISTLVYRELSLAAFYDTLVAAARTTAMVMFLVGCAMVAAWLITVAQLPQQLAMLLGPLVESPRLLMLCIMILVLLVGMVMDLAPTVLILVPLLMPVVTMAGIDPIYFGLMFILNCSIGLLTPPVGTVLNVVCGVGKVQLSEAVRGTAPFLAAYVVLLGLFIAFPQIIIVPARVLGG
jgi:TRAP-type transport system large permease protein